METLYITHPSCRLHDMGDWHPESPDRLDAISDQMLASGLASYVHDFGQIAPVTREALLRVHTADYLDRLEAARNIPRPDTEDLLRSQLNLNLAGMD